MGIPIFTTHLNLSPDFFSQGFFSPKVLPFANLALAYN